MSPFLTLCLCNRLFFSFSFPWTTVAHVLRWTHTSTYSRRNCGLPQTQFAALCFVPWKHQAPPSCDLQLTLVVQTNTQTPQMFPLNHPQQIKISTSSNNNFPPSFFNILFIYFDILIHLSLPLRVCMSLSVCACLPACVHVSLCVCALHTGTATLGSNFSPSILSILGTKLR